jgi:hypothetical protein
MARIKHTTPPPKPQASQKALETLMPAVDYPQTGEKVAAGHYAIRLSAPQAAKRVEVSINQGPWQACRPAGGYWWFDWSAESAGEHEVVARAFGAAGRAVHSAPQQFYVKA